MIVSLIREAILDENFIKELFQKVLIDKDVQSSNEFELADVESNN